MNHDYTQFSYVSKEINRTLYHDFYEWIIEDTTPDYFYGKFGLADTPQKAALLLCMEIESTVEELDAFQGLKYSTLFGIVKFIALSTIEGMAIEVGRDDDKGRFYRRLIDIYEVVSDPTFEYQSYYRKSIIEELKLEEDATVGG